MEVLEVFTCVLFPALLIFSNSVSFILAKFHISIIFINRNVITYLNFALVISVNVFVNFQVKFQNNIQIQTKFYLLDSGKDFASVNWTSAFDFGNFYTNYFFLRDHNFSLYLLDYNGFQTNPCF